MYQSQTIFRKLGVMTMLFTLLLNISCSKKEDEQPTIAIAKGLSYNPSVLELTVGTGGSSVKPGIDVTGTATYSITTSPVSNGAISISNEGIITASPALAVGDYQVSVSVTNSAGTASFPNAYRIKVSENLVAISSLTYSPPTLTMEAGETRFSETPTYSGTKATSFSVIASPATNAVSIDSNGKLSFGATLTAGTYKLSVTATNALSSVTFTNSYTLTVTPSSGPKNLTYNPNLATITTGNTSTSAVPTISSSSAVSYSITTSPATTAIIINSQGVISSSNNLAAGTYKVSVVATNANGSRTFADAYTITVNAATSITTFNNTVKAILQNNCGSCHSWHTSYATTKSSIDEILRRINLPQGATGMMPNGGQKLSQTLIDQIQKWKNDGLQE